MKKLVSLLALAMLAFPASAQERDDLEKLVGRWVHDSTGEIIKIEPAFIGWELWHGRRGQFALVLDGTAGAHIKMSGRGPTEGSTIECFYYVSMIEQGDKMVWNRRGPSSPTECAQGTFSHTLTGKTRAEEIADVRKFRAKLMAQVAVAPVDMAGIEVIYFERAIDNGKVREALEGAQIAFSSRDSGSPERSNVITCQRDVPIAATKHLARKLIEAKVPIRLIRPTQYQQFSKRLTIEYLGAWAVTRPLITLAQVDAMTSCNVGNLDGANLIEPVSARPSVAPPPPKVTVTFPQQQFAPPPSQVRPPPAPVTPVGLPVSDVPIPQSGFPKVPITVNTGACSDTYNVTARFWSPTLNAWQWTNMRGVSGQETFKNGDGTLVTTSTRDVYFFVRNLSTNQPSKLAGAPVVFPGSDVVYYKRGPDLVLNCR